MSIWNIQNLRFFYNALLSGWLCVEDGRIYNGRTGNELCKGRARYPQLFLRDLGGCERTIHPHAIIWMYYRGYIDTRYLITHRDSDPHNWNINNLVHVGEIYNPARKGERASGSKMTDEQVVYFRLEYASGRMTAKEIRQQCRISKQTVSLMLSGVTYAHLPLFKKVS